MKDLLYGFWFYKVMFLQKVNTIWCLFKYNFVITNEGVRLIGSGFRLRNMGGKDSRFKLILRKGSSIKYNVIIQGKGVFELGKNSYLSHHVIVGANERVVIGENVMVASYVSIRDTDHSFERLDIPMKAQGIVTKPVIIEDNVWIGAGAVITKGITIGSGAIIGANAVVTKNVPRNAIMGGVPARIIKYRE